jgi:hypothetical protein
MLIGQEDIHVRLMEDMKELHDRINMPVKWKRKDQ